MVNSFYDQTTGLVHSPHTAKIMRPFLWGVNQATKPGRDFIEEEAREFHNTQKMEFDKMIKMMNRAREITQELYYGFLSEHWTKHHEIRNHHTFTQILCRELPAARVIQRAFRWYRYYPGEKFCKQVQLRGLCDICPDMDFNEEIQKL
jgi:hypothetical protein